MVLKEGRKMKTVILAEKNCRSPRLRWKRLNRKKHPGYYVINDPILPANTVITFGLGHLSKISATRKYDAKYKNGHWTTYQSFPEHYQFVVPADKKTQFKIVQDQLKQAETIIVATDSDREGEISHGQLWIKPKSTSKVKQSSACGSIR